MTRPKVSCNFNATWISLPKEASPNPEPAGADSAGAASGVSVLLAGAAGVSEEGAGAAGVEAAGTAAGAGAGAGVDGAAAGTAFGCTEISAMPPVCVTVLPTLDTITTIKSFSLMFNEPTVAASLRIFPIVKSAEVLVPASSATV